MHDEGVKFYNRLYPFNISNSYLTDDLKLYLNCLNLDLYEYYMGETNLYTISSYIGQDYNRRLMLQAVEEYADKNDLDIEDILKSRADILVPLNKAEDDDMITLPGTEAHLSEAFSLCTLAIIYPFYIIIYLKNGTDLLIRYENHMYFTFGSNPPSKVDIIGVF